jgi:pimeloyl-ACP methyl ester carboxylesterase
MSTPPFVEIPNGVVVERWPVRGSERAVMWSGLERPGAWVVLVPGFTGSKEDFIAVLPLLAERGVAALAFDQLGQHESDGSDVAADYGIGLLAGDLAEIVAGAITRFGRTERPDLVGHSFGGLVAQHAVADGLDVASFVALCTGPGALPSDRHGGLADLVAALPHTDLEVIWALMQAQADEAGSPVPAPAVQAFLRRRWLANHPLQIREFGHHLMRLEPVTESMRARVDAGLAATVMWGENDDAWPVEVQSQMALDWGVSGVQLVGVGHSPNAERPELLVTALLAAAG